MKPNQTVWSIGSFILSVLCLPGLCFWTALWSLRGNPAFGTTRGNRIPIGVINGGLTAIWVVIFWVLLAGWTEALILMAVFALLAIFNMVMLQNLWDWRYKKAPGYRSLLMRWVQFWTFEWAVQ